jgi:hypothetical protein
MLVATMYTNDHLGAGLEQHVELELARLDVVRDALMIDLALQVRTKHAVTARTHNGITRTHVHT